MIMGWQRAPIWMCKESKHINTPSDHNPTITVVHHPITQSHHHTIAPCHHTITQSHHHTMHATCDSLCSFCTGTYVGVYSSIAATEIDVMEIEL